MGRDSITMATLTYLIPCVVSNCKDFRVRLVLEKIKETGLPDIPAVPHQPADLDLPRHRFGRSMHSYQASWFKQFAFLHYDESKYVVYCHTCVSTFWQKIRERNIEPAFISSTIVQYASIVHDLL